MTMLNHALTVHLGIRLAGIALNRLQTLRQIGKMHGYWRMVRPLVMDTVAIGKLSLLLSV
jgi:hypothetical protein